MTGAVRARPAHYLEPAVGFLPYHFLRWIAHKNLLNWIEIERFQCEIKRKPIETAAKSSRTDGARTGRAHGIENKGLKNS
jgi:hypothetical protein